MIRRRFINPSQPLLEGVVGLLCSDLYLRTSPMGAASLAHCMLVVPTMESGRQLRLALAQRFNEKGLLSPRIVQPSHLIQPVEMPYPEASTVELLAALIAFLSSQRESSWSSLFRDAHQPDVDDWLGFAQQCVQLWQQLSTKGYTFQSVAMSPEVQAFFQERCVDEQTRWDNLACFEAAFFEWLHIHERCAPVERFAATKQNPQPLDSTIETLILPALVDPMPLFYDILEHIQLHYPNVQIEILLHATPNEEKCFDCWGRPTIEAWVDNPPELDSWLSNESLHLYLQNNELAEGMAKHFSEHRQHIPMMGLSVLDNTLFTSLELAFQREGLQLHNPSLHALHISSLGRLTLNILTLLASPLWPWAEVNALLHDNDVLTYLEMHLSEFSRVTCLKELNAYQNAFFPQTLPTNIDNDVYPTFYAAIIALRQLICLEPTKSFFEQLRHIFSQLYTGRTTGAMSTASRDEFLSAIHALTQCLNEMDADLPQSLTPSQRVALFSIVLKQTKYELEASSSEAMKTLGWLELAWSRCDYFVLAGLSEGILPQTIVGHPFLPNQLCQCLQLNTNEQRLARDTFLFSEILRSHAANHVHIAFSLSSSTGEVQKPSRLLFLCQDETLITRVSQLFGEVPSNRVMAKRTLPERWQLQFPIVGTPQCPCLSHLSPSAIDAYLRCPFTYFLSHLLKLKPVHPKREPGVDDFGTILHAVLDHYAKDPMLRESKDETIIYAAVKAHFDSLTRPLRTSHSKNLSLVLDALDLRLKAFAQIQSSLRQDGWKIVESEYSLTEHAKDVKIDPSLPFTCRGVIDRIDYKEGVGYRIIDYKTWDRSGDFDKKLFETSKKCIEALKAREIPSITIEQYYRKEIVERQFYLKTVQLHLYRYLLETSNPKRFKGQIVSLAYCVLGESLETSALLDAPPKCVTSLNDLYPQVLNVIQVATKAIYNGCFWPPSPAAIWKRDYAHLFLSSPEEDLPYQWILSQCNYGPTCVSPQEETII